MKEQKTTTDIKKLNQLVCVVKGDNILPNSQCIIPTRKIKKRLYTAHTTITCEVNCDNIYEWRSYKTLGYHEQNVYAMRTTKSKLHIKRRQIWEFVTFEKSNVNFDGINMRTNPKQNTWIKVHV